MTAVHDVSTGGLGAAAAEMAIASGVGCTLARVPDHRALFSESPSRVLVAVSPEKMGDVETRASTTGVPFARVGLATGDRMTIKGLVDVAVSDLDASFRDRLPDALGSGTTQG